MVERMPVSLELAQSLIRDQSPDLAALPLRPVPQSGTDHALFRLGEDLCARFPIVEWAAGQPAREVAIRAGLESLPLAVPDIRFQGEAGQGYPWPWLVLDWLPGEALGREQLSDAENGYALAAFLNALHRRPAEGLPRSGPDNHFRGAALFDLDKRFRSALPRLADAFETARWLGFWQEIGQQPVTGDEIALIHGDLSGGNVILRDGRLSGVIDWGLAGVGDIACDGLAAFSMFSGEARDAFWAELAWPDETSSRAMAWSLAIASIAQAYYRDTGSDIDVVSWRILRELEPCIR